MNGEIPNHLQSGSENSGSDKPNNTLWILTEVYWPEDISTGYYLTTIAEGLAKHRTVKVITGQPKHMSRGKRAPKREVHNDVEIFRAWGTTFDKNVFVLRLVNMLTIGLSVFFRSLWSFRRGDRVLVCTAPPNLVVTTTLASLIRGAGVTPLVQDSYPDILIAVGATKPNSLFARTVNFFNRWVYKHASRIIVMGRDMHELFARKTAGLDASIVTIPNWADLDTITPLPRSENTLLKQLGLEDKFVCLYAGNIGHPTDVETIIEAADKLNERPEIHFVFIGAGVKKRWLEAQVPARRLTNVTILDYRPWNEQNEFLNACDVGLIALIKGMWGTAMPSRTYNIMAAGKPIIALTDKGSELARVIDEERVGWHLEPNDPELLRETILKAYENRHQLTEIGTRARNAAVLKYTPAIAVEAYRKALE